MSVETIGHVPALSRLELIDGQDFTYTFTVVGAALPGGTVVAIEILNRDKTFSYGIWPVTALSVRIDATDHAGIPHGSWFRLWTTYPSDGGRFCWIAGPVERNRR